ncbi:MAG TPA: FAD-dependent thymidylate synthase [Nitrososphaeraceae archaeon]|nr:FAD-dependent thymidylate synthase [Nitrososphaeraceae archaeon]
MKIELLDYFGNDLMIVNAARVSFGKSKIEFDNKDEKLIKYLKEHKHTSVFRHPQLQFRIECPIFVERQLFKHQIGWSANSISGRYVDFSDSYYVVSQFRTQSTNSKQGSGGDLSDKNNKLALQYYYEFIEECKKTYDKLLELGVSKEQARMVLPLALNTQFIWTGSLLAFFHLCELRLKPDAQKETRDLVKEMLKLVKNIEGNPFKHTLEAFNFPD